MSNNCSTTIYPPRPHTHTHSSQQCECYARTSDIYPHFYTYVPLSSVSHPVHFLTIPSPSLSPSLIPPLPSLSLLPPHPSFSQSLSASLTPSLFFSPYPPILPTFLPPSSLSLSLPQVNTSHWCMCVGG